MVPEPAAPALALVPCTPHAQLATHSQRAGHLQRPSGPGRQQSDTTLALIAMCSDAHVVRAAIMRVDADWGMPQQPCAPSQAAAAAL